MVASIRAGYRLLENGEAKMVRTVLLCFYPPSLFRLGLPPANEGLEGGKNPEQRQALLQNHHHPSRMG